MTGRTKFILTLILIFSLFVIIQTMLLLLRTPIVRSLQSVMNQYYEVVKTNPNDAKNILDYAVQHYPNNAVARRELYYWYLKQNDLTNASIQLETLHQLIPQDKTITLELGMLYGKLGKIGLAKKLLADAATSENKVIQDSAKTAMQQMERTPTTNTTNSGASERDLLMNIFYAAKQKNDKVAAKIAITNVLAKYPKDEIAEEEAGYLALNEKMDTVSERDQLMNIFYAAKQKNDKEAAKIAINNVLVKYPNDVIAKKEASYLTQKSHVSIIAGTASIAGTMSDRDQLMNNFYNAKKNNDNVAAWIAIKKTLARYPNDVLALKEAGYFALSQKNQAAAFVYFDRAYLLTNDSKLAMQNGYILSNMGEQKLAYHYFDMASKTDNSEDRIKAEIAKTNLRGVQTKIIPYPFFADLYFTPFHQSRFKLLVYPIVGRIGFIANQRYNWQIYLSYRRTTDNKSGQVGQLSQIYNDNAAITALGSQFTPFPRVPLFLFLEVGRAFDIVYRNRPRWRNDLRGGVAYFQEWGVESRFTLHPTFVMHYHADIYGDIIKYSRYANVIGTMRVRPGLEFFRYQSSSINLYLKGFMIEDVKREFFNNIFECGPGISFIPSDRYNIALRYENLSGHYLPAGSPSPNPYRSRYHNNLIELDSAFRF